jgi:hypothetical protein
MKRSKPVSTRKTQMLMTIALKKKLNMVNERIRITTKRKSK